VAVGGDQAARLPGVIQVDAVKGKAGGIGRAENRRPAQVRKEHTGDGGERRHGGQLGEAAHGQQRHRSGRGGSPDLGRTLAGAYEYRVFGASAFQGVGQSVERQAGRTGDRLSDLRSVREIGFEVCTAEARYPAPVSRGLDVDQDVAKGWGGAFLAGDFSQMDEGRFEGVAW